MKKSEEKFLTVLLIGLPVLAVILELLPFGAVLTFAPSPAETARETYSYFSMLPMGYGDVGPFFTAVLTCVILLVSVVSVWKKEEGLLTGLLALSVLALLTSLMPLAFGVDWFSAVGAMITVVIAAEIAVVILYRKRKK